MGAIDLHYSSARHRIGPEHNLKLTTLCDLVVFSSVLRDANELCLLKRRQTSNHYVTVASPVRNFNVTLDHAALSVIRHSGR